MSEIDPLGGMKSGNHHCYSVLDQVFLSSAELHSLVFQFRIIVSVIVSFTALLLHCVCNFKNLSGRAAGVRCEISLVCA